jgi:hypothetical protein
MADMHPFNLTKFCKEIIWGAEHFLEHIAKWAPRSKNDVWFNRLLPMAISGAKNAMGLYVKNRKQKKETLGNLQKPGI